MRNPRPAKFRFDSPKINRLALRHHSIYPLAVVSARSQIPLFLFVHLIFVRLYAVQILFRLQCCTIEVYRLLYTSIYYKLLWLYIICLYVTQRHINAATKPELLVSTQKRSATWWQKVATLLYRYPLKEKDRERLCGVHTARKY